MVYFPCLKDAVLEHLHYRFLYLFLPVSSVDIKFWIEGIKVLAV